MEIRTPERNYDFENNRIVVWFSCGVTSAVCAKLATLKYPKENLHVVYCDTGSEHPSNEIFLKDVEAWINHPIEIIKSEKYKDVWDVWEKRRYIAGVAGAPCTLEMKKSMRQKYEQFDDIQVFGFDDEDLSKKRPFKFIENNPEVKVLFPLIEGGLTKPMCFEMIKDAGIGLPFMYHRQKSGTPYGHNNCIGCPKGGQGYWNKIRIDFPEVFDRMAKLERELDAAINKTYAGDGKRKRLFLDELPPDAGDFSKEPNIECDMFCRAELDDMEIK